MSDPINPSHYKSGDIECIDAIQSAVLCKPAFQGYLVGNIIKYLWRYEMKGGVEDVKKARWYVDRLINQLEQ